MANLNDALQRNHPIWGDNTFSEVIDFDFGGTPAAIYDVPISGSYLVISNRNAVQLLEVRTQNVSGAINTHGIPIATGDSFAFATSGRAVIRLQLPAPPAGPGVDVVVLTWFPS